MYYKKKEARRPAGKTRAGETRASMPYLLVSCTVSTVHSISAPKRFTFALFNLFSVKGEAFKRIGSAPKVITIVL